MTDSAGRYLSIDGAAEYTGLSASFLYKLAGRRRIPVARIGKRLVFDKALLDRWISRRQALPAGWATERNENG